MKIYKYPLEVTGEQVILVPKDARFLSVANQNDEVVAYFAVFPDAPPEPRRFFIVGTGHEFVYYTNWDFVGTVPLFGGNLMWHIFLAATP